MLTQKYTQKRSRSTLQLRREKIEIIPLKFHCEFALPDQLLLAQS